MIKKEKSLSLWFVCLGACLMIGSGILAGRLIWEMTLLTWRLGPQMVGFSLMHGSAAFTVLFPPALMLWVVVGLCIAIFWKAKKNAVSNQTWASLFVGALVMGTLTIPSSFFDRIFVGKLAGSSHAADFLLRASAEGSLGTVKALLKKGVPIDATDRQGDTALHQAAAAGETGVLNFLLSDHAKVNALNLYGDSPLHRALANHRDEVAQLLLAHGAQDIKGSDEQREQATREIVKHDIEVMRIDKR